jgi:serine/threonine protein kinase
MNDQEGQHLDKQFGSYRLIKLLGEGGFAEVYLGEHVRTGTQAALKVLATKLVDDEIALFRREAQMMLELDHPNIIHIYDYGMEGRIPFIVMAYASNGSLRQLHPKSTCLPLPTIINYVKQIADGLQYMHNKRLIHRDLKPENMLIDINGKLVLSDFGIAAIAHSTNSLQTQGQTATIAQLNESLNQDKNHQNYQIASDSPQPVQIPQVTPISNGLSMIFNFTPTGKIIQKISNDVVKSQIRGKTASDAEITLKNLIPTIQRVNVKILPGFFPLAPLLVDHIDVKFVALLVPQKK